MNVLVTGATGFVGRRLIAYLHDRADTTPFGTSRSGVDAISGAIQMFKIESLGEETDWSEALQNIDIVIHTAARVHVMHDKSNDPYAEYHKTNYLGTMKLARQAALAGVKRLIFLSSIKVNGEVTQGKGPFTEDDVPRPVDPYGISKYETEVGLLELANENDMDIVCIRPPMVYGPGVKANFLKMMRWLNKGVVLPFGKVNNKRSIVALDNLVDFIGLCLEHPAAKNQIFLVSDGCDLSTTELLRKMANALGVRARLLPLPCLLLESVFNILGKTQLSRRLCASLQVDISKAKNLLGWQPPITPEQGFLLAANDFLDKSHQQ